MRRNGIITLGWVFVVCAYAMGQTSNGTIQGFVSDTSGAVIPKVTVVVTNEMTGAVQRAISTSDGSYIMPGLLPGQYSISVTFTGFSRFLQSAVKLEINQQLRVDIVLKPGSQTQVVSVTGAPTQVETRTAALSQVVGHTEMIELPLNGRFTVDLVGLSAGVAPMGNPYMGTGNADTSNVFAQSNSQVPYTYNISGGRGNAVNYMLNGGSNMDPNVNTSAAMPSPDAVQEFSLQNTGYEAEFSGSGGTVNLVTKSGTNLLHGAAYNYLRNGVLNARNFFSTTQDTLIRNQFGFAVGGPAYLPKIYDGRNRTFFFVNYEGTRQNANSSAGSAVTPTAAMRTGELSAISTPVIDPTTGLQFKYGGVANVIPPSRLDQGMGKMLTQFVGLPGSDGRFHYTTAPVKQPANQYTLRGDENLREHGRHRSCQPS